ncbi:MAG: methyltransferase domain-containing protein [Planctomycetes bacterium]|nr:methyltransferase domain-containing protein [Planctomycetota bacterium]
MAAPSECPVCSLNAVKPFLDRGSVPVHQNLLMKSAADARNIRRGRLTMHVCQDCGFVFNAAFDAALMSYNQDYENTQVHSAAFNTYVDGLVQSTLGEAGVRGGTIVEVGCGKGDFIKRLLAADEHARGYGFDPSYIGPASECGGRLKFEKQFYDASCADLKADIVVCRHVIEHIAQPLNLVRSVRTAVAAAPNAHVFFETPCVDWILRNRVTWDFFYEHCSLFTAASLTTLFARSGFAVQSVKHLFGGQYLWLHAMPSATTPPWTREPSETPDMAARFCELELQRNQHWTQRLRMLSTGGKVVLWGAGAKAVTFANLIDPECQLIQAIVDVNPGKQGRYLPGTGHPIIAPESLVELLPTSVVVLNPNYCDEIGSHLAKLALNARIIDLMNDETHPLESRR